MENELMDRGPLEDIGFFNDSSTTKADNSASDASSHQVDGNKVS